MNKNEFINVESLKDFQEICQAVFKNDSSEESIFNDNTTFTVTVRNARLHLIQLESMLAAGYKFQSDIIGVRNSGVCHHITFTKLKE